MRILFDSKKPEYKQPFGCLKENQAGFLRILIPLAVKATRVVCNLQTEDGKPYRNLDFAPGGFAEDYQSWQCDFTLDNPGLYFYRFTVAGETGTFRLFKQGDGTNMECGELWQVTCIPEDFAVPEWAKGATIYQVFPDRFFREGVCDLTGKLGPYVVHNRWEEEVFWQPDSRGRILNNDFYGGNFRGITAKLPYIASLGTTMLYLNPICKSFSSHRYDTGDYKTPDPMLGTMEEFKTLCKKAHDLGIRVISDAVFSHTGADSLYFNREHSFDSQGAYQSPDSPYASWYTFKEFPDKYVSWWDFDTLPTVNKLDPGFLDYLIEAEDSVVAHWLAAGVDGFRLDVADELPNEFMSILRRRVRKLKPDALVMGEVWEDASNKIAYGVRRRYFADGTLDSVMNYPFRAAILDFLRDRDDGREFKNKVMTILENYPRDVVDCNMNPLGTHDTPRILTALVDDYDGPREMLAQQCLDSEQKKQALRLLRMASFIQYTLPGSPSLYYGDEAGMEGAKDPFNRRTYPWGREDLTLLAHFRKLGSLRKENPALRLGDTEFFCSEEGRLGYTRTLNGTKVRIYVNRTDKDWQLPKGRLLMGPQVTYQEKSLRLAPMSYCIVEEQ